jgi:putative ubiquitin-RnfH superfamily antitoxin RatB of RatAB toxin-antitoxin module
MVKYEFSEEDCRKWMRNKSVNPKTNRPINPQTKNGVYAQLEAQCRDLKSQISEKSSPQKQESVSASVPVPVPVSASETGDKKELKPVKHAKKLWSSLERDQVIVLAARVLDGDEEAVKQALELHKEYCRQKKEYNSLFDRWRKTGQIDSDRELELAGEFLGRFCRCVKEITSGQKEERAKIERELATDPSEAVQKRLKQRLNDLSGVAYGSCQKSIYNNRGLKGVATRGDDKVECDEDLAAAQNVIKSVAPRC